MRIGQAKNLEMCIIFYDMGYQFLSFDCDINVTPCDIFATLKNLTKQKRVCESFVLRTCDPFSESSRPGIKKRGFRPFSLPILVTYIFGFIAICQKLLPLAIMLLAQCQPTKGISSPTRNKNLLIVKSTRHKKTYFIITHIILLS